MNTMPFGKYKGLPISRLPASYLDWLCTIELRPFLRAAVEAELLTRRRRQAERTSAPNTSLPDTIVARWYLQAALKYHPDRGGSPRDMQVVNECRELLLQELKTS